MATQKLRISIPEPCHERWDHMSPTEKGAYCQSCAKEVMDFTDLTAEEVAYYFKHNASAKTCGRFRNDQLNTAIPLPATPRPQRAWMSALWMVPLTLLGKSAFGQQKPPVCERPANYGNIVPEKLALDTSLLQKEPLLDSLRIEYPTLGQAVVRIDLVNDTVITQNTLRGRVINATTKAGLPLAIVKVNDSLETRTDSTGNFRLEIPEGVKADSATVMLEGFSGKFIPLKNDSKGMLGDIALEPLVIFEWNVPETILTATQETFTGTVVTTVGFCTSTITIDQPALIEISPGTPADEEGSGEMLLPTNILPAKGQAEKSSFGKPQSDPEKQNKPAPENPGSQKQPEQQAVMPVNNSQRKRKN